MPELDSLRGIAILLVVFCHGFFWSSNVTGLHGVIKAFVEVTRVGWLGVNLFFVLSGFLITGILLDSRRRQDYFRRFYTRRALRILPAYYGILLLILFVGLKPRAFVVLSFIYLSNVTPLFGVMQSYGVLWSLAVEEHFYLLWPSVVRKASMLALERVAIGVAIVVPALRLASYLAGWRLGLSQYTWLAADGLAMGAWLAICVRKPGVTREKLARISVAAIAVTVVAAAIGTRFGILTRERPLGAALQLSCADLLFLGVIGLALVIGTGPRKSLVRRPTLRFFGNISYGLYLIHVLVFMGYDKLIRRFSPEHSVFVGHFGTLTERFFICATCATTLAFLSRRYFEEPFLRLKERFDVSVSPPDALPERDAVAAP